MSADAPSLRPGLAAIEDAAAVLIEGCFFGGLESPVITIDEARGKRARGDFLAAAWEAGARAEIALPRWLLRHPERLLDELFHQLCHQTCAEAEHPEWAQCGGWHPWPFAGFLAETLAFQLPPKSVPNQGFAAVRPRRGAGELFSRLRKVIADAVRLRAATLPRRGRSGRNLRVFWCACEPPRPVRRSGEQADALCLCCRQPFKTDESAA